MKVITNQDVEKQQRKSLGGFGNWILHDEEAFKIVMYMQHGFVPVFFVFSFIVCFINVLGGGGEVWIIFMLIFGWASYFHVRKSIKYFKIRSRGINPYEGWTVADHNRQIFGKKL